MAHKITPNDDLSDRVEEVAIDLDVEDEPQPSLKKPENATPPYFEESVDFKAFNDDLEYES